MQLTQILRNGRIDVLYILLLPLACIITIIGHTKMEGNIKEVISYWFQGEIHNFIKVWLTVVISICYCDFITRIFPKGPLRLFFFFPIISLFFILPFSLHTIHLGVTSAFLIVWLANFKLIMLAFGCGPLSDDQSILSSFPRFLAVACLPIKIKTKTYTRSSSKTRHYYWTANYSVKAVLLGIVIKLHDYDDQMHPITLSLVYCLHIYLGLEIFLAVAAAVTQKILGVELERTFRDPFLATSIQDFWGQRWNIMVNRLLRPSVYDPLLNLSSRYLERKWAPLPAVFGTFLVSGLMHELMFYYMGHQKPTWKMTCYFLVHGSCMAAEVGVKKALNGKWQLPKIVGRILTLGFVLTTSSLLFVPDLLRLDGDIRAFQEYAALGEFVKDAFRALTTHHKST